MSEPDAMFRALLTITATVELRDKDGNLKETIPIESTQVVDVPSSIEGELQ